MNRLLLSIPLRDWVLAGCATALLLGALILLRRVVSQRLTNLAARTNNDWDDLLARLVQRTSAPFLLSTSLLVAAQLLALPAGVHRYVDGFGVIVLVIQGALWSNAAIAHFVQRTVRRRAAEDAAGATTVSALGFIGRLAVWSVLLLLGLDNLGVDITALVAGLGIGGIAVALALQKVLGDLFASLAIVLDKPFVMGDFIIIDDLMGTVEHVGLKTTRVRSLFGEQIIFANADLLASRIRNYKRMQERRIVFALGVTYDTPPEKVARIPTMIRTIVEAQPQVRFDRAHFKAYGAFSLDFEVVYYALDPDYNFYMDVQQDMNLAILRRFADEDIEFAFPTQTLQLQRKPAAVPDAASHRSPVLPR